MSNEYKDIFEKKVDASAAEECFHFVVQARRYYREELIDNSRMITGFTPLHYYAFTDLPLEDFKKMSEGMWSNDKGCETIHDFYKLSIPLSKTVNKTEKYKLTHSVKGKKATKADVDEVLEFMKNEDYPSQEVIHDLVMFALLSGNIEAVSKENIRSKVTNWYIDHMQGNMKLTGGEHNNIGDNTPTIDMSRNKRLVRSIGH